MTISRFSSRSIFCFLILVGLCSFARAQKFVDISFGNTYHRVQEGESTQLYKFNVPEPLSDVSVYLSSNGDNFFRMFGSKTTMGLKSNSPMIDYFRIGTHFLMIDISAHQLSQSPDKMYYIGVDCVSLDPCDYQLRLEHPSNYTAGVREKIYPRSSKNGSDSVVVFKIPQNETTNRLVLSASRLYTRSDNSTPLHAYVFRNNSEAANPTYSLMFLDTAWDSGLATIIHKSQPEFCTGCNWTMRVVFDDPVVLQANAYAAVERIRLYARFDDVALPQTHNTYVINLEEDKIPENASVVLNFQFYEGFVHTYIHPDVLPDRLDDYLWNITSYGEETIRISAAERKKLGFNKKIYISVSPSQQVAYSISYRALSAESKTWYGGQTLYPEKAYKSFIQDGEVQTFWYHPLCNSSTNLGVFAETGNIYVAVMKCEYFENCYFTPENFTNLDTLDKIMYYSNSSKMWKSGVISATHANHDTYCHYAISVLGASKNTSSKESSFEIWVDQHNTVTRLVEGTTFKAEMSAFTTRQFSYRLLNDTGVDHIRFQINPLSGRGQYKLKFAPYSIYQQPPYETTSTSWNIDVHRSDVTRTLAGDYYLNVTAVEASIFFITPIIYRNSSSDGNKTVHKPVTLPAGVAMRYSISKDQIAYFKFTTNFPKSFEGSVSVLLQPIRGKFKLEMTVDNKTDSPWKSSSNELTVSSGDKIFEPQGTYLVAVSPLPYDRGLYYDTYSFSIAYVNSEEFLYLRDGFPFFFTVSKAAPKYFEIDYFPEDGDLMITKSSRSEYEIYLSLNPSILLPNHTAYTAKTQNTFSIRLKESELRKACQFSNSTSKFESCIIYASAFTNLTADVDSYILVSKSKRPVDLAEGLSSYHPIVADIPFHFNFYPSTLEKPLVVKGWSQYRKVSVFAKVKDYKAQDPTQLHDLLLQYPTNKDADFSAKGTALQEMNEYKDEFVIPADKLKQLCNNDLMECVVTLTVYAESGYVSNDDDIEPPIFSIMVTGDVQKLDSHVPTYDLIFKYQVKYYEISISESKCENCTLFIDITSSKQDDVMILLSKGTSSRPTPDDADFTVNSAHFKLTKSEAKNHGKEFYGEWTIGVYSFEDANYQITVSFKDNQEALILGGHPFAFSLDKSAKKAFQYYLDTPGEIEIRTYIEKGKATTTAYVFKNEQTRDLPVPATFIKKAQADGSILLILPEETAKQVRPCYISITLEAHENNTAGNLVVLHPNENIVLMDGNFYTDILEPQDRLYFKYQQMKNSTEPEAQTISNYIDVIVFAGNITASVYNNTARSDTGLLMRKSPLPGEHFFGLYPQTLSESDGKPYTNFYVVIEASSHAKFSIVAGSQNKKIKLADGVMHTDYLDLRQEVKYAMMLPTFTDRSPYNIKININLYNEGAKNPVIGGANSTIAAFPSLEEGVLVMKQPNGEEFRHRFEFTANYTSEANKNGDYSASQLLIIGGHELMKTMTILNGTDTQASLEFKLKNPHSIATKYSVIAQVTKPIALPVGGLHVNRVSNRQSVIYEIFAAKSGTLAIELVECYGKVRMEATDSIEKLNSGHWDLRVNVPSEEVLYGHLKVNRVTIYVRVSLLDGVANGKIPTQKEALYKFQTRLFGENNILPYDSFYRGKNGIINWNINLFDQSKLDLIWGDASADRTENIFTEYDVEPVYNVLITKDRLTLETYSKCGFRANDDELDEPHDGFVKFNKIQANKSISFTEFAANTRKERNQQFEIDSTGEVTYYAIVVAILNGYAHGSNFTSWSIPLIYDSVQISVAGAVSTPTWIIIAVVTLTVAVIVVGCLLCKYYKRYKLTQARLQFEMQDIRNVATTASEEEVGREIERIKHERHTVLVEEKEKTELYIS